jgi:hypothetical protein
MASLTLTPLLEKIAGGVASVAMVAMCGAVAYGAANSRKELNPVEKATQFLDGKSRDTVVNHLLPMRRSALVSPVVRALVNEIYDAVCLLHAMSTHAENLQLDLMWKIHARTRFVVVQRACHKLNDLVFANKQFSFEQYIALHERLTELVNTAKIASNGVEDAMRRRFAAAALSESKLPPLQSLGVVV